jgi:tripartite-type tricarboxylate transporter receptor subunit TctC
MNLPLPSFLPLTAALRTLGSLATVALLVAASASAALARGPAPQAIRIVVGVGPGVGADVTARLLAQGLEAELGEPVIVDNRPGADGFIAARQVASAPPDGRTLLFGLGSQFAINPAIFASLPYDPQRDFAPITLLARQPALFVAHPSLPVTTLRELLDHTRAHPSTVNYGTGTSTFMLIAEAGAIGSAQAGRLRVLAVSGDKRLRQLPGVPTLAESGQGDEVPVWTALLAPAGTPPRVVHTIREAVLRVLAQPSIRERWTADADVIVGSTPEELAATILRDTERMKALVKEIALPLR